jgi:hypothetical protein
MITATICIVVVLVFGGLFLKVCSPEIETLMTFFKGLADAGLQETTFRGGMSARANIILCLLSGALFAFLELHGLFKTFSEMIGGSGEQDGELSLRSIFLFLLVFFLISLAFVSSNDRYRKRMGR